MAHYREMRVDSNALYADTRPLFKSLRANPMLQDPLFYMMAIPAILIIGISKGGFGGALAVVAVPMLTFAVDPVLAAAILLPVLCTMDLIGVKAYWKQWDMTLIKNLIPAAVVGILLGSLSFHYFNTSAVRLLLGVIAIGFALQYWFKRSDNKKAPSIFWGRFWSSIAGFTSFVAHAGGPPISVYLLPLKLEKSVYQATTVLFFTLINYIKLIPYFWLGQLNTDNLITSLVLLPLAFVGMYLGIVLHHRIPEQLFYRLAYVFLFITGLKLLWDGITGLL